MNPYSFDLETLHIKVPEEKTAELFQNLGSTELTSDQQYVIHIEVAQFLDALMVATNHELWKRDFRIFKKKDQILVEFSPIIPISNIDPKQKKNA